MHQPAVISEYVQSHVAERNRLARYARTTRAKLARQIVSAQRELERLIRTLGKGAIPETEAENAIAAVWLDRDRLKIELEAAPSRKIRT